MKVRRDERTCWIYLVRHGATVNNLADPPILQGRAADLALSPDGQVQAEATARLLNDHPLDAAYSSPLRRARETAEVIAQRHGKAVTVIDELTEVDVGSWEGRDWDQIQRDTPEAYRRFMADPGTHGYLDGETFNDVLARVGPVMNQLARHHLGQAVLVVGHNGVNRSFLTQLLDLPMTLVRGVTQDNCGVNLLRYREDDWKVVTLNNVFHL